MILEKNSIYAITSSILHNSIYMAKQAYSNTYQNIYDSSVNLKFGRHVGLTTAMIGWLEDTLPTTNETALYVVTNNNMATMIIHQFNTCSKQVRVEAAWKDMNHLRGMLFDYIIVDPASCINDEFVSSAILMCSKPNTLLINIG